MSLSSTIKQEIITTYKLHEADTASTQVQVALITAQLNQLNEHFKHNPKDHHSRRGLMKMVGRRRKLLHYLNSKDAPAYRKLIADLGLRK